MKQFIERYKKLPKQVRATLWFMVCSFWQKGVTVISTPIFTRLLSSKEYGQFSVFNSWLNILTVFVTLQLYASYTTQGLIKFESERKQFASSLQGLTLCLTAFWTVIYLAFHNFWNKIFSLTTVQMLAMLVMMWATAVWYFWAAEKRVSLQYRNMVLLTLLISVAKPVVGIIFVLLAEDKVTARILGLALVEMIGYTGLFVVQMKRGKVFFSKRFWLDALSYSIPLIPHYLSQTVLNSADKIMIEDMISASAAGIYGLAYSISQIMKLFHMALGQSLNPWEYQKIKDRRIEDIPRIIYPTMLLIAGANLVLIAFAPEIVRIFAPASYYEAIWIIPPVTMSVYFFYAGDRFIKVAFYYEKTKNIAFITALSAILNVVLNYIFIPVFGYYAAGYTTLICYMSVAVFHYFFLRRMCRRYLKTECPYDMKTLIIMTGCFMLLGFIYMGLYRHIAARYLMTGVLLLLLFRKRRFLIDSVKNVLSVKKKAD